MKTPDPSGEAQSAAMATSTRQLRRAKVLAQSAWPSGVIALLESQGYVLGGYYFFMETIYTPLCFVAMPVQVSARQGSFMNKDQAKGAGRKVTGSLKEAIGKMTGDKKTQAEGTAEKSGGKSQGPAGNPKGKIDRI